MTNGAAAGDLRDNDPDVADTRGMLRVVRGSAAQAATAPSVNHTVKLPRWRRLAS